MRTTEVPILSHVTPVVAGGAVLKQSTGSKGTQATNNASDTFLAASNFTAGSTVIFACTTFNDGNFGGAAFSGVTLGGTAATEVVAQQHSDNANYRSQIWVAENVAGGTNAIAVTWISGAGPNHYCSGSCEEWTNMPTSALDKTATNQATATSITATTATTTQANELVYCVGGPTNSNASGITGPSSGFTQTNLDTGSVFLACAAGYKQVFATGAYSGSVGQTASAEGDVVVATFKTN